MAIREIKSTATKESEKNQLHPNVSPEQSVSDQSFLPKSLNAEQAATMAGVGTIAPPTEYKPLTKEEQVEANNPWSTGYEDFSGIDYEYMSKIYPDDKSVQNNLAAMAQGNWSKLGNAIGSGSVKGVLAVADMAVGLSAWFVDFADEDYAREMNTYMTSLKGQTTEAFNYSDYDLSKDPTTAELFLRFNTLESGVESAVQFAAMNAATGFGVGLMAKAAVNAGLGVQKGLQAIKVGKKIAEKVGGNIHKVLNPVGEAALTGKRIAGQNWLKSNQLIGAFANNYMEGRVMSDQLVQQMTSKYADMLNDPNVSQAAKQVVLDRIDDARSDLEYTNTLLVFNDFIGLGALSSIITKKGFGATGIKALAGKKGLAAFSATEYAEEQLQTGMEGNVEHQALLDIERGYENLPDADKIPDVPGINPDDYKPIDRDGQDQVYALDGSPLSNKFNYHNALLSKVDPERAEKLAVDNARTLGNYIMEMYASEEARSAGMAGAFGGGPQYMLTGLPRFIMNRKALKKQREEEESVVANTADVFQAAAMQQFRTNGTLEALRKELADAIPEGSEEGYLNDMLDDYVIASTVINAIKSGNSDAIEDMFKEHIKTNKRLLQEGQMTQEEYDNLKDRIKKGRDAIAKYKKYDTYANSDELLTNALKQESLKAAINAFENTKGGKKTMMATAAQEAAAESGEKLTKPGEPVKTEPSIQPDGGLSDADAGKKARASLLAKLRAEQDKEESDDVLSGPGSKKTKKTNTELFNERVRAQTKDVKLRDPAYSQEVEDLQKDPTKVKEKTLTALVDRVLNGDVITPEEKHLINENQSRVKNLIQGSLTNKPIPVAYKSKNGTIQNVSVIIDDDGKATILNAKGKEIYKEGSRFKNVRQDMINQAKSTAKISESQKSSENVVNGKAIESTNESTETEIDEAKSTDIVNSPTSAKYLKGLYNALDETVSNEGELKSTMGQFRAFKALKLKRKYEKKLRKIVKLKSTSKIKAQLTSLRKKSQDSRTTTQERQLIDKVILESIKHLSVTTTTEKNKSNKKVARRKKRNTPVQVKDTPEAKYSDEVSDITDKELKEDKKKETPRKESPIAKMRRKLLEEKAQEKRKQEELETNPTVVETNESTDKEVKTLTKPVPISKTPKREVKNTTEEEEEGVIGDSRLDKLKADKVIEKIADESPQRPTEAGDEMTLGSSKVNSAKAQGNKEDLADAATAIGNSFQSTTFKAYELVVRVIKDFIDINESMPSLDWVVYMVAGVTQQSKEKIFSYVEFIYNGLDGASKDNAEGTLTGKKKYRVSLDEDENKTLKPPNTIVLNKDLTSASFVNSATALAHDGPLVRDHTKVPEGSKIEYELLTDEQVEELNTAEIARANKAGVEPNLIADYVNEGGDRPTRYAYGSVQALRKEAEDNPEDESLEVYRGSDYSKDNSRPIAVKLADGPNKGAIIGYVHTLQWITKPRTEVSDADAIAASARLETFRQNIISGTTTTGTILARKSNIIAREHKVDGVTIKTNIKNGKAVKNRAKEVFGADNDLVYSLVYFDDELGRLNLDREGLAILKEKGTAHAKGEAPHIVIPEGTIVGNPVVLIPIENTGIYKAQTLGMEQANREEFSAIMGYFQRVLPSDSVHKRKSPLNLLRMFEASFDITYDLNGRQPQFLKFNIEHTQTNDQLNPNTGTLAVEMGIGTQRVKLDLNAQQLADGGWAYEIKEVSSYDTAIAGKETFDDDISIGVDQFFKFSNKISDESLPFFSINRNLLHNSQREGKINTGYVFAKNSKGKWALVEKDYIGEVLLNRSNTYLDKPLVNSAGTSIYTVNTIMSLQPNRDAPGTQTKAVSTKAPKVTKKEAKAPVKEQANRSKTDVLKSQYSKANSIQDLFKKLRDIKNKIEKGKSFEEVLASYPDNVSSKLVNLMNTKQAPGLSPLDVLEAFSLDEGIKHFGKVKSKLTKEINKLSDSESTLSGPSKKNKKTTESNPNTEFYNSLLEGEDFYNSFLDDTQDEALEIYDDEGVIEPEVTHISEETPSVTLTSLQALANNENYLGTIVDRLIERGYVRNLKEDGSKC